MRNMTSHNYLLPDRLIILFSRHFHIKIQYFNHNFVVILKNNNNEKELSKKRKTGIGSSCETQARENTTKSVFVSSTNAITPPKFPEQEV